MHLSYSLRGKGRENVESKLLKGKVNSIIGTWQKEYSCRA